MVSLGLAGGNCLKGSVRPLPIWMKRGADAARLAQGRTLGRKWFDFFDRRQGRTLERHRLDARNANRGYLGEFGQLAEFKDRSWVAQEQTLD